jgi:hypothetical protein
MALQSYGRFQFSPASVLFWFYNSAIAFSQEASWHAAHAGCRLRLKMSNSTFGCTVYFRFTTEPFDVPGRIAYWDVQTPHSFRVPR